MRIVTFVASFLVLLAASEKPALATPDYSYFNFEYSSGNLIASGVVEGRLDGIGIYMVNTITGQRNGQAITGTGYGRFADISDSVVYPASPFFPAQAPTYVSGDGFLFTVGTILYNVFEQGGLTYEASVDLSLSGGANGLQLRSAPRTPVTLTISPVPEPASAALLAGALSIAMTIRQRQRRT